MSSHARVTGWVHSRLRDPVVWIDVVQLVKTVVAAVVAWIIAAQVFGLPQPFLAPWGALLVVHATVYRSFWTGAKQITATVIGVLLAWVTGNTLGLDPTALAVMLLAALLIGQVRWLRDEATTAAATALIVLTTGFSDEDHILIGRLYDTAIGVGVGVFINALVWPPLQDLTAARAIKAVSGSVGELLEVVARECGDKCSEEHVQAWVDRTQQLDEQVDEAWALVRQARESGRLNPRRASAVVRNPGEFGDILSRTEQALAEIRSIARTVGHSITDTKEWDSEFRTRWTDLLGEVAWAIQNPDAGVLVEIRARLGELADDYSSEDLPSMHWPEYGGLILNLRNIATAMDHVAESHLVADSEPRPSSPSAL